jgi:DNA-binding transcriptional LysR family regulator
VESHLSATYNRVVELEIRHLRYFLTLAEETSFTRAAKRLGIAQSALSAQVQRIERHLGVPLVRRGARRMDLTLAGEQLAARAKTILDSVQAAEAAVRSEPDGVRLRLGCFRAAWWPNELSQTIEDNAGGVRVVTEPIDPEAGLREVRAGRLDACLYYDFPVHPLPLPAGLSAAAILREPIWVALPAGHPSVDNAQVNLSDLDGADWLLHPGGSYLRRVVENLCQQAGFTPRPVTIGDSWDIAAMVSQGRGVVFCTPTIVPRETFFTRPLNPVHWRRIFVAWRTDDLAVPVVRQIAAAAAHLYSSHLRQVPGLAASPYAQPQIVDFGQDFPD